MDYVLLKMIANIPSAIDLFSLIYRNSINYYIESQFGLTKIEIA
jgi:hypothetical protein